VLDPVLLNKQLGLLHTGKEVNVQEFIPEPTVE
jgi:hypothetical protein